jgi:N-acetylglutamate synthase-like GNAT family acetyltransferase
MPIRRAEPRDVPAIERIVEHAYEGYVQRIGRRPSPMDQDYAERVREARTFVWDEGGVRGVLVLVAASDHLLIENVAVDPLAQHRGIGRGLLEHAEREAVALGLDELRLYTNAAMTENLALYPRLAYREDERRSEGGFERVYFSKRLGHSA